MPWLPILNRVVQLTYTFPIQTYFNTISQSVSRSCRRYLPFVLYLRIFCVSCSFDCIVLYTAFTLNIVVNLINSVNYDYQWEICTVCYMQLTYVGICMWVQFTHLIEFAYDIHCETLFVTTIQKWINKYNCSWKWINNMTFTDLIL